MKFSINMTLQFKSYFVVFFLTGISIKTFDRKKSFRKNLMSIISHIVTFMFMSTLGITIYFKTYIAETSRELFFLYISFYSFCVSAIVMLTFTIVKKSSEKNFWDLMSEVERIFKVQLSVNINLRNFNFRCILNVLLPTALALSAIIHGIIISVVQKVDGYSVFIFGPILFIQLFIMKFMFYLTVLRFWLNKIKKKLNEENISLKHIKYLQRAYFLCWKMSLMIEDIFGSGILANSFKIFFSSLISFYILCDGGQINVSKEDAMYGLSTNIVTMLLIGGSCQACIDCAALIAPLMFKRSSKGFHLEAYALQTLHQRIVFKPHKVFEINYESMTSVRFVLNL